MGTNRPMNRSVRSMAGRNKTLIYLNNSLQSAIAEHERERIETIKQ